jgi:hypothetical protein
MKKLPLLVGAVLAISACSQQQEKSAAPPEPPKAPQPPAALQPATPKTAPVPTAADPKSAEAAAGVVARFAELLKARRYVDAHRLWSGDSASDRDFAARFSGYSIEGAAVGAPGPLEGAAGSIYVEVPLQLFFTSGGTTGSLTGPVTLKRVNDVSGSTEEQRRWHIVKTELQPAD